MNFLRESTQKYDMLTTTSQSKILEARSVESSYFAYSDASFANNYDLTSQLGRITLLMDDSDADIPISLCSGLHLARDT